MLSSIFININFIYLTNHFDFKSPSKLIHCCAEHSVLQDMHIKAINSHADPLLKPKSTTAGHYADWKAVVGSMHLQCILD